jgi:MFS family permease
MVMLACIQGYFARKRALALGIYSSGVSLGGALCKMSKKFCNSGPIIISNLIEQPNFGFAWSLRISAFISIPLLILSNIFIKKRLPPREPGPFVDLSFFRDPRYCLFVVAQFCVLWGLWTPYFFVQSIAAQVGIPNDTAFYLVAIINFLSLLGRIIPGIIADKVGPFNCFVPSAVIGAILTYACIGIHNAAGLYAFCVLYGLFSGHQSSLSANDRCRYFITRSLLCSDMSRYEKDRNHVWHGHWDIFRSVPSLGPTLMEEL